MQQGAAHRRLETPLQGAPRHAKLTGDLRDGKPPMALGPDMLPRKDDQFVVVFAAAGDRGPIAAWTLIEECSIASIKKAIA